MKRLTLILLAIFFGLLVVLYFQRLRTTQPGNIYKGCDPLLVCVLMVKNEEPVIVETVEPFFKGGVDAFFIFDTGSTDKTVEKITNYFAANKITKYGIEQEPFVDFSTSRNRALDLAEQHFPQAGFFIMMDAEWYINGVQQLLRFCKHSIDTMPDMPLFALRTLYAGNNNDYAVARLFRAQKGIRFKGVIHEVPDCMMTLKAPDDIYIDHAPSRFGDEKTLARTRRDIGLLTKEIEKDPENPRNYFYLGQSYSVLHEYENSVKFYKKRTEYEGFDQEKFVAYLRVGQLLEQLFFEGKATWQEAEEYFLKAFAYRPRRAEPLIHIANHYMHYGNPQVAYDYVSRACTIPYPDDILGINKELYDYDRWNILARVAQQLELTAISKQAAHKALAIHPDVPELQMIVSA